MGRKRARAGPVFSEDPEYTIIPFIKAHSELYTKVDAHYMDTTHTDALCNRLGEQLARSGGQPRRWFESQ